MGELLQTYSNYKKLAPHYEPWKEKRNQLDAKNDYLAKTKPLPQEKVEEAKQKADVLARAVDVLDDYSQTKAEDVEATVQSLQGTVANIIMIPLSIAGLALGTSKFGKNMLGNILKSLKISNEQISKKFKLDIKKIPSILETTSFVGILHLVMLVGGAFAYIPIHIYSAKLQIGASKIARFEGMEKELSNPNDFAVLTDEQKNLVNEKIKSIPDEKESKIKKAFDLINVFSVFKTSTDLLKQRDRYKELKEEHNKDIERQKNNFDKPLTKEEIFKAKQDQRILTNLIEKVDIASQDYSERLEMLTNICMLMLFSGGALEAFLVSRIIKRLKINNKNIRLLLPIVVPFATVLPFQVKFAEIQKKASKVGRWKAVNEMKKNPYNFIYRENDELNVVPHQDTSSKHVQEDNMFTFLKKAYEENKAYNKYQKEVSVKNKKIIAATRELKLNNEQIKEAKRLQKNTFYAFNKIDDNSQKYAENVEAFWEIIKPFISIVLLMGMGLASLFTFIGLKVKNSGKFSKPILAGILAGLIPGILLEIHSTKEQRQASRVADMKAINELNQDYRMFADYNE